LRNQFNTVFADTFGGRQRSLDVGKDSANSQDTMNSKAY
jgi:hypothetical protein